MKKLSEPPARKGGVKVASISIPNSIVQVLPSWDRWVEEVSLSRFAGDAIGRGAASPEASVASPDRILSAAVRLACIASLVSHTVVAPWSTW